MNIGEKFNILDGTFQTNIKRIYVNGDGKCYVMESGLAYKQIVEEARVHPDIIKHVEMESFNGGEFDYYILPGTYDFAEVEMDSFILLEGDKDTLKECEDLENAYTLCNTNYIFSRLNNDKELKPQYDYCDKPLNKYSITRCEEFMGNKYIIAREEDANKLIMSFGKVIGDYFVIPANDRFHLSEDLQVRLWDAEDGEVKLIPLGLVRDIFISNIFNNMERIEEEAGK